MIQASSGRALRCRRCGGVFSVAVLTPEIACAHCGQVQSAAELAAEVDAYGREVGARLHAADRDYARAAQWATAAASNDTVKSYKVAMMLTVGVPVAFVALTFVLVWSGIVARDGALPHVMIGGACLVGVFAYLIWHSVSGTKVEARRAAVGGTQVACPNCGAPGVLTPGQGIDNCAYCGAALVPTRTSIARGLDAARQAAAVARIARHRAERRNQVNLGKLNNSSLGKTYAILMIGFPVLMVGVALVGYTVAVVAGSEAFSPMLPIGWVGLCAVVGPGAVYLRRSRERSQRWREALDALVRQFGGRLHPTVEGWVGWLDCFWAGRFDISLARRYGPAAALDAGGYPALIVADVPDMLMQSEQPQLAILLAAWVPGRSDGGGRTVGPDASGEAARRRLTAAGYKISIDGAGVCARAGAETYRHLYRHPAAAYQLAPALADLAALATSVGAEPMQPIPG